MKYYWMACVCMLIWVSGCGGNRAPVAEISLVEEGTTGRFLFDAKDCYDQDGRVVSYLWRFGDGISSSESVAEHQYEAPGIYEVQLTITDNEGAQVTAVQQIEVVISNTPPISSITTSSSYGIVPFTVTFSSENSIDIDGEIAAVRWQIEGAVVSTAPSLEYSFSQPGQYSVILTVADDFGVETTSEVIIDATQNNALFSVEGHIASSVSTDVDGDVNDPRTAFIDNNGADENGLQGLTSPVLLNGYLTERPTFINGDVFAFSQDLNDFYSVNLRAGEAVSLQIINYTSADIDLYLLDAETYDVLQSSTESGEFESLTINEDGNYIVLVSILNGESKYLLKTGFSTLLPAGMQLQGKSGDFEPGEFIVKSKGVFSTTKMAQAQLELSHENHQRSVLARMNMLNPQTRAELSVMPNATNGLGVVENANPRAATKIRTLRAMKYLSQDEQIDLVEPNYKVRPMWQPSDPAYAYQWHFPAIQLPDAWDVTLGEGVIVAVVDSGIYSAHPDLRGQFVTGYDFISTPEISLDGDGIDPDPEDSGESTVFGGGLPWHGTHVSGIIAAAGDNNIGGVGAAPEAKVMPLRVIGYEGGETYDVLQAVRYAAGLENDSGTLPEQTADIINLSLGGDGFSSTANTLYREVREQGIFIVSASGNQNSGQAMYPASYQGVISVAATDLRAQRAVYSNFGPYVDIAAPGGNLNDDLDQDGYSDGILSSSALKNGDIVEPGYLYLQGTSMAAPHVSGVLALMKSINPLLTPDQFDSLLIGGKLTGDRGDEGRDDFYGYGVIDANKAVLAARDLAQGAKTAAVVPDRYKIEFDYGNDNQFISVNAIGNTPLAIEQLQTSKEWIAIDINSVDENGFGVYEIKLDRQAAPEGVHEEQIIFIASDGSRTLIHVVARVGLPEQYGRGGLLYVLLMEADSLRKVNEVEVLSNQGDEIFYRFENVPPGEYLIAASSDIDNDGVLCRIGEFCGFYPTISEHERVAVYRNVKGVNFLVGLDGERPDIQPLGATMLQRSPPQF